MAGRRHDVAPSRAELLGHVFLEHYMARWEELDSVPAGWNAQGIDAKARP